MKNLFLLSLIVFSINSHATLLIDGSTAFCESKIDVIKSLRSNVYRLNNPSIEVTPTLVTVTLGVQFLHCVESNNEFNFVTVKQHMKASYDYPVFSGDEPYEYITIHRVDKMKEVVALNADYSIVGQKNVRKEIGTQSISIKININDLDINTFTGTQEKGDYFTTVSLRTITQHYSMNHDFGSKLIAHGQYRIFIDLKNETVSF
jgi:hypothetical protein